MLHETGTRELLEKLQEQSGFDAVWSTFRQHMEEKFGFGTGYYGVLVMPDPDEGNFLPRMHNVSDLPEDYISFVQQDTPLWQADPILPHCLTTGRSVSWKDLRRKTLEHEHGQALLAINHELGLLNGFAAPVETGNKKAMIALNVPGMGDEEFDRMLRSHETEIEESFKLLHYAVESDGKSYEDLVKLTAREQECLLWSAAGLSSKHIALKLGISHRTVENCLFRAIKKLKASNKTHAVYKAVTLGLIQP